MFIIGYDPDFAPIAFRNADAGANTGANTGTDPEADGQAIRILRAACARAGIDCRFLPVPLPEQEKRLFDGDIDALATVGVTPERQARLALSPPLMETGAAWFARAPFDPAAAADRTCVTTPVAGPLFGVIKAHWPHLELVAASDYTDALRRVVDDEVAAAALNLHVGQEMVDRRFAGVFHRPKEAFLKIPLALACPRGRQTQSFERLSVAIAMAKQGRST